MPRYESYGGYEQDSDIYDSQQGQQQDEYEDNNNNNDADTRGVGNKQSYDGDDHDQWGQQQSENDDNNNNNNAYARGVGNEQSYGGEDHDQWGQQQSENDDNNNKNNAYARGVGNEQSYGADDHDQWGQQQSENDDNNNNNDAYAREVGDEQKAPNSSNVTLSFKIELGGDLKHSDLHEGGIMFSKKLLTQLFSGPGEHDPNEKEVPVHQVQHKHMDTAGSGDWTLVVLKAQDANGADLSIKAKLDCGADDNFMSFEMLKVTGLEHKPYEGPEGPSFTLGGGQLSQPLGQVCLRYTAGIKPQKFIATFQVLDQLPHDVVIGTPLMTKAHMMMVDPNFANPPKHPAFCLLELRPRNKESKAKAEAFQRQRRQEQMAAREAEREAEG